MLLYFSLHKSIPIHRVILTAVSKYFAASLGPNFVEGKHDEFTVEGVDGETLRVIIEFCYIGHINLTEENVKTFLIIASSVELDLLEEKCRAFYNEKLSARNAVEAFMIADKYSYADLRQRALNLICDKFRKVPMVEIQKLDHRQMRDLLKSENINSLEELIFDRVLDWWRNDMKNREAHLPRLLQLIQLKNIDFEVNISLLKMVPKMKFMCTH